MRAVIASGTGRYADPWHPFDRTSSLLAETLHDAGFAVTIDEDVDGAMARLDGIDLLVVNAGDPWRDESTPATVSTDSVEGFAHALARGIGVLAMHCAVSSMRDYPEWPGAIGAMWVPGLSFHPPGDVATITGRALPEHGEIDDFRLFDERYCRLQRIGRSSVVAVHDGPNGREPTAWVRTTGVSRIAVDVLGHDERSYESVGHRRLIRAVADWLVDGPGVSARHGRASRTL